MNKILSFLFILLLVLMCACKTNANQPIKNETTTTKEYSVASFTAIEVYNTIDVKFSQGKQSKLVVTATPTSLSYLKVEVKNGKLTMFFDTPVGFKGRLSATVTMSAPTLTAINSFNSSDFEVVTPFKGEALKIETYNSAEVEFKQAVELKTLNIGAFNSAEVEILALKSSVVNAQSYNSADVELGGTATKVSFEAYNNGGIDAAKLQAKSGKATAFNSGTIKCNVTDLQLERYNGGKIKNEK